MMRIFAVLFLLSFAFGSVRRPQDEETINEYITISLDDYIQKNLDHDVEEAFEKAPLDMIEIEKDVVEHVESYIEDEI